MEGDKISIDIESDVQLQEERKERMIVEELERQEQLREEEKVQKAKRESRKAPTAPHTLRKESIANARRHYLRAQIGMAFFAWNKLTRDMIQERKAQARAS